MCCLNLLYQKKVKIGTYRLPASQEIVTKTNHCQKKNGVFWCVCVCVYHHPLRSRGAETPENSIHLMLFCQDIVLSFIIFQVHHLCSKRSRIRQGCTNKDETPKPTLPGMGWEMSGAKIVVKKTMVMLVFVP